MIIKLTHWPFAISVCTCSYKGGAITIHSLNCTTRHKRATVIIKANKVHNKYKYKGYLLEQGDSPWLERSKLSDGEDNSQTEKEFSVEKPQITGLALHLVVRMTDMKVSIMVQFFGYHGCSEIKICCNNYTC